MASISHPTPKKLLPANPFGVRRSDAGVTFFAVTIIVLMIFLRSPAQAATVSWTGGSNAAGGIGDWNTKQNWSSGNVPGSGDEASFTSVVGTSSTPALSLDSQIGTVTFQSGAAAFNIGGAGRILTIFGIANIGITNNSITTQTFSVGTIALNASQTWSAAAGALSFTGNSLTLGANTLTISGTRNTSISNVISGTGGLTKTGTGTLTLSGTNSYTGATTITSGMLSVSSLANGGANSNIGASSSAASNLVLGGGGSLSSATLLYTGGAASTNRLFTLDSGTNIFDASGSGALNFTNSGAVAFNGTGNRSLTLNGSNTGENTIAASFSDPTGGVFALLKTGSGTWSLTGTNNYTGTTFIGDGTLGFNNGSLGTGLINFTNPNPANGNPATLRWNTGNTQDVSSRIRINDGVTAAFNTNGNNVTFASALQTQSVNGSGALVKSGAGTLTLGAANTYSGGTTVAGGSLLVNGGVAGTSSGTGSGTVIVNSGGTLGGSGAITGATTILNGGNLSPGGSPTAGSTAILHTGALTLSSGSFFNVDLNGLTAGSGYDRVVASSIIGISGSNLSITVGGTLIPGNKFFILNNSSGALPGLDMFAQGATVSSGGYTFAIDYADNGDGGLVPNDISLTVLTAVPEPSTWIGGALALAAVGFMQRKRLSKRLRVTS